MQYLYYVCMDTNKYRNTILFSFTELWGHFYNLMHLNRWINNMMFIRGPISCHVKYLTDYCGGNTKHSPCELPHSPRDAHSHGQSPLRWPSAFVQWSISLSPLPLGNTHAGTWRPSVSVVGVPTASGDPSAPGSASTYNKSTTVNTFNHPRGPFPY